MLIKYLFYALFSPIIVVGIIAQFVMWEIISSGRWKKYRRTRFDPTYFYQEQVASLTHRVEEERRAHQDNINDLQRKHQKEMLSLRSKQ